MKNKKVLFVATVVKKHINVFHLPYLKWFQEQGYETHVCARDDFNGEKCVIPYCDKHFDIPFERSPLNKNNIKAYRQLKKIINENNYEIVHCHTPVAAMLTRLAARRARNKGTKVIYTAHGFHFFKGGPIINWLVYYPIEWICSYFTDILITINQEDFKLAKRSMKSPRIEYVYGVGVDINKFSVASIDKSNKRKEMGIPEGATILLSVGEINKNKNHKIIIQALSKLNNRNVYYLICGQGPLEAKLQLLSKNLGVEKNVIFLGFRKDVLDFYEIADIFVFPSYREGLSLSLMEAMATENPCIVSKIRGNTDLIKDENYLINPNNVHGFVMAIKELVSDSQLRNSIGLTNKKTLKKYDLNMILKRMEEIYIIDK